MAHLLVLLPLVVLELDLLANDQLNGFQRLQSQFVLGEGATLGQRLRVVHQCFVDVATLMHQEALQVRFILSDELAGDDTKATPSSVRELLRKQLLSLLVARLQ